MITELGNGLVEVTQCYKNGETGDVYAHLVTFYWADVKSVSEYNFHEDWKHLKKGKCVIEFYHDGDPMVIIVDYPKFQQAWLNYLQKWTGHKWNLLSKSRDR